MYTVKNPDEINNTTLQTAKHFQHEWNPPTTKYTSPCFHVGHKGNGFLLLISILYLRWKHCDLCRRYVLCVKVLCLGKTERKLFVILSAERKKKPKSKYKTKPRKIINTRQFCGTEQVKRSRYHDKLILQRN